jgi:hypothetical protein
MGQKTIHIETMVNGVDGNGDPCKSIGEKIKDILTKHPNYKYVNRVDIPSKYQNTREALLIVKVKKKGKKKHEKILAEVERQLKANDRYCMVNSCEPTDYMGGSNNVLEELKIFINKL